MVRVSHRKVSGKSQGSDPTRVYGNHWDEDHVVEGLDIGSDVQAHDTTLDQLSHKSLIGEGAIVLTDGATLNAPQINSPTGMTKDDVGLDQVDNTSDADKPISDAAQTALDAFEGATQAALAAKQPLDADLTAIAALSGTGVARRTGVDGWSVGTAVANSELATMATGTIKGNVSGSVAVPSDLTAAQVTSALNVVTTSAKGLAPQLPNDATKFLDGTGHYSTPSGTGGTFLGTIQGLNTANNASDANNDIDIGVGSARDTTNTYDLVLASGITKRLDAAWVAGTNQGGLDTGSKANNTSYHIFLIRKTSDGSIDALFSTSPTNPVMPSGYAKKRRIASIKTDSSGNIYGYIQNGGYITLKAPASQTIPSAGPIALTTATQLPLGVKLRALLLIVSGSTSGGSGYAMMRDPDLGVPSTVNALTGIIYKDPLIGSISTVAEVWSSASAQFYTGSAFASPLMFFVLQGWFDLRDEYQ
ncbi:hypothetical protein [Bradyrhizobium sp. SYSU BS000235]|uniref:hypothetical protein n=1 Tax=Bradyrhizobium sp. SYSU BS000235 TaxID=3411332 RepID=UPI003C75F224